MPIFILILTFFVTLFLSFGVQFGFYLWYKKNNPDFLKKYQHVLQYWSGLLGDGLFVPLINVFAVLTLNQIAPLEINFQTIILSFLGGLIITFLFHFGQQHYKLINWTMPEVGNWNLLGLYHAIFMFFESSFLIFTLISFIIYTNNYGLSIVSNSPIKYGFLVLFIFFVTFVYDYWKTLFKKIF